MAKSTVTIIGFLFWVLGCEQSPKESKLCIVQNLGQHELVELLVKKGDFSRCEAIYQDPQGNKSRVQISKHLSKLREEKWKTYVFENQVVFYQKQEQGVSVVFQNQNMTIRLFLEGMSLPQGPVLRAYLFAYRSTLRDNRDEQENKIKQQLVQPKNRPKEAADHLGWAREFRRLDNNAMAVQELFAAIDADRSCSACYLEMADLYLELRQWDLAIQAAQKGLILDPDQAISHWVLGKVYQQINKPKQAQKAFGQALKIKKGIPSERLNFLEKQLQQNLQDHSQKKITGKHGERNHDVEK